MKVPSGKFVKKYASDECNFKQIADELVQQHFNGYLETSRLVDGIPAKGYLVFEGGIPVVAYYEHTDSLNCKYAIKSIYEDIASGDAEVSTYELTQSKIDVFKRYISCVNKPGKDIVAIDMFKWDEGGRLCPKWGSVPKESSCNVCKEQCTLSVANPDHFIAKKFIKNFEIVRHNRLRMEKSVDVAAVTIASEPAGDETLAEKAAVEVQADMGVQPEVQVDGNAQNIEFAVSPEPDAAPLEPEMSDEMKEFNDSMVESEKYMAESVEQFKAQSSDILESLGLGHLVQKIADDRKNRGNNAVDEH